MINRFEATGIFISVSLMALALFLLNMETATEQLAANGGAASVVLTETDDAASVIQDSINKSGALTKLIIDDVVVGTGEPVKIGDTVSVHYIGTLQNGQQFDNSYLRGTPFSFTVGEGTVIKGWDEAIIGMRTDGQRIIVIPAEMAYGDQKVGPIPANSTLVFAIELVEIN